MRLSEPFMRDSRHTQFILLVCVYTLYMYMYNEQLTHYKYKAVYIQYTDYCHITTVNVQLVSFQATYASLVYFFFLGSEFEKNVAMALSWLP